MESLEKAIRTAFDKGDPLDPAYRKRVYRSALTALEKSAAANPAVTDEMAASRRDRLKDVIRAIETEFRPAAEPEPQPEPEVEASPAPEVSTVEVETPEDTIAPEVAPVETAAPQEVAADVPEAPTVEAPEAPAVEAPEIQAVEPDEPAPVSRSEPEPEPEVEPEAERAQEPTPPAPQEEPESELDVALDLEDVQATSADIGPVGTGAPEVRADDRDTSPAPTGVAPVVDEPRATDDRAGWRRKAKPPVEKDEPEPEPRSRGLMLPFLVGLAILVGGCVFLFYKYGQTGGTSGTSAPIENAAPASRAEEEEDRSNWIGIFDAGDPSTVSASAGTELEILDRDQSKYLRVNAKANKSATVTFEVGQGVMRDLAGKHAVFDIAARAQEGKVVEISVECDFGASGGCGRQRYEVGFAPGDYLFDVEIPAGAGDAAGKIIVRPDSTGSGAFIDISELRATVPNTN